MDEIIHTTTSRFSFLDGIRILLGSKVIITSMIETNHSDADLTGVVKASTTVTKLFPSKFEGQGLIGIPTPD